MFYEVTGIFSLNIWEGFLQGLYDTSSTFDLEETCLGGRSRPYLESMVRLTEQTIKEDFFLHLAGLIRELTALIADIRENCHLDMLVKDVIKFCRTQCQPQKMLTRFAVNMNKVGAVYTDLLKVLFESFPENLRGEAEKLGAIGTQVGKMLRLSLSFDLFTDKFKGKYSELYDDDEKESESDFAD